MYRHASVNRIYRLVWSHASSSWIPVAETTRGRGKGSCKTLIAAALLLGAGIASAGPIGGQVMTGSGSIVQSGALTTITQATSKLSLTWASFNIAPQETVDFVQPSAGAIAVNRISDTNGTQILGHLNANGQVYLINPNGIVFGRGAQVDVGGLVASTLDLPDASLNGDARTFSGNGSGRIVNNGTINASGGGYVALLGNQVSNRGVISAQLGSVALGAGSAATLTFKENSLVHMQVDRSVLNTAADNGGLIRADGGQDFMSAGAKDALLASVVNNTGVIEARTVENHAGTITLLGGMTAGSVNVGGTLDASAPRGGNGGFIETSAAHVKIADAARVTTAAAAGLYGSWLIDPQDFTVAASGGDTTGAALSTNLANTNEILDSGAGATAGSGNVNVNDPVSWNANTTLTLTASNDVNINASLTATGNSAGLIINPNTANRGETPIGTGTFNLNNGAAINLPGTTPSLSIAGTAYTVINALGAAGSTTGADLQGINGGLSGHYALGSNVDASPTVNWNGGAGFTPIGDAGTSFAGTFDGLGHTISNLSINLPSSARWVGLFGGLANGSAIRNVGLLGGSVRGGNYVGALVGENHGTIDNSYATGSVTGVSFVGGLAGTNYGSITHSHAAGEVIGTTDSSNNVGGLVGLTAVTISDSYATGNVAGAYNVGGLAGLGDGTMSNSYATGDVSGIGYLGGFAGFTQGSITNSYATGNVSGAYFMGGLVGLNEGPISNSYAMGNVTGNFNVGGLVGANDGDSPDGYKGSIDTSYSTGEVSGLSNVGGLAGSCGLYGTINNSYWNTTTSGQTTSAQTGGGQSSMGGLTTQQMQSASNFAGFSFTTAPGATGNSWVMVDVDGTFNNQNPSSTGATFPMLTSEYSTTVGNAHQLQLMSLAFDASYTLAANIDASATARAAADGSSDVWSTTGGFVPIGTGGNAFTGSFNGFGHTIAALTIDWPTQTNVGLFGLANVGSSRIQNVGLVGGSVTGNSYVGALVGMSYGSISNSYATGKITGDRQVGGLVGGTYGTIANSYSTGVVAGNNYVGGLVGTNFGATFTNTYATGTVTGHSSVGGLAGTNKGSIANSYATGNVSGGVGGVGVGGLVGNNYGSIANAYATGTVIGDLNVGGLVGTNYYNVSKSFWNSDVIGTGVGSNAGTVTGGGSLTGDGMYTMSNFADAGWSISNAGAGSHVWRIYEGSTAPLLNSFLTPLTVTANNDSTIFNGVGYSGGNGVTYAATRNSNLLGTVTYGGSSQGAVGASSYAITPGGLYSNQQGSSITFISATLTISPLALNGSIAGGSTYGVPLAPGTVTFTNLAPGYTSVTPTVALNISGNLSSSGHLNAGTYLGSVSASSVLGGADAGNYTFAGATGNYTVSPLTITATAIGANRVYDGTRNASPTLTGSGLIGGDQVTFGDSAANFASPNVGPGNIVTVSGITIDGADAGDYLLSATSATATASITPKTLTVSAQTTNDKVYDGTVTATLTGGNLLGVIAADSSAVALTRTGSFASQNASPNIAVTAADKLSGTGAGNYILVQPTGLVANITPATLTYNATPASRTAGQAPSGLSGSLSGFVAADTQGIDTTGALLWTTTAGAGSQPGQYAIDGGGLTAANYVFVEAPGNAAALTLQPAAVPPPVPSIPAPPQAALNAIAQLQSMILQSTPDAQPDTTGVTRRTIGLTGGSLLIVDGGVRLPK